MEENVMQQQATTDLVQMTEAINDIVPAGSTVTVDVPAQPVGPTTMTQNYIPSKGNKVAAFGAGAAAAGLVVGGIIGIRFLIKKHKAKKAAQQAETIVPQNDDDFFEE